jgi:signal transduction histidine kinase
MQRLEAVGQLIGGVAHDFNNILSVILANSCFLIESIGERDPRRADAEEIRKAGERAASLTRQLLAFSRRQVLEPTNVDLNVVVHDLEKMLRRLIGEDIDFSIASALNLGSVLVDAGQIEQVIMNLVVNSRDAMPTGGKLSIETANVDLDESYAASHIPLLPGKYVMIAVSDTGCGMDAATRVRALLHHEGEGQGHGAGSVHHLRNREAERRPHLAL